MDKHSHVMIRRALQLHRLTLEQEGFVVSVLQDGLQHWQTLVAEAPPVANWCFRPDRQPDITAGNSFAILVREEVSGAPVSTIVLRLYDGFGDLADLIQSGRLWYSPARALEAGSPDVRLPEGFPEAKGRIFQMGGLVVWPAFRGHRIGWHLARMIRWTGFQLFDAEHAIGLELPKMAETQHMPLEYYGYARVGPVAKGIVMDTAHDFYLTHISRPEALRRLPGDIDRLESMLAPNADPQELVAAI